MNTFLIVALVVAMAFTAYALVRGVMAMAIFGNIVTAFSWFGVNMLGVGLHAYGFTASAFRMLALFGASQAVLIGLCLFALLVETIGFVLAASQLIFLMTVRKFRWYKALPSAIAISIVLLLAFQKLLGVFLPVNDFGW